MLLTFFDAMLIFFKMQLSTTTGNGHEELYIQVGHRIRQARKAARLTQEKLAKRVSLTRTSVTNIEKGRQKILLHTLADLAYELHIPVAKLLPDKQIERQIEDKLPKTFSLAEKDFVASVVGLQKNK